MQLCRVTTNPYLRKDFNELHYPIGKKIDEKVEDRSFEEMNAIARGVESRLDQIIGHSKIVMDRTVAVALHFGMSQDVVQRWVKARQISEPEKGEVKRSLFAEAVEAATRLLVSEPNLSEYVE